MGRSASARTAKFRLCVSAEHLEPAGSPHRGVVAASFVIGVGNRMVRVWLRAPSSHGITASQPSAMQALPWTHAGGGGRVRAVLPPSPLLAFACLHAIPATSSRHLLSSRWQSWHILVRIAYRIYRTECTGHTHTSREPPPPNDLARHAGNAEALARPVSLRGAGHCRRRLVRPRLPGPGLGNAHAGARAPGNWGKS